MSVFGKVSEAFRRAVGSPTSRQAVAAAVLAGTSAGAQAVEVDFATNAVNGNIPLFAGWLGEANVKNFYSGTPFREAICPTSANCNVQVTSISFFRASGQSGGLGPYTGYVDGTVKLGTTSISTGFAPVMAADYDMPPSVVMSGRNTFSGVISNNSPILTFNFSAPFVFNTSKNLVVEYNTLDGNLFAVGWFYPNIGSANNLGLLGTVGYIPMFSSEVLLERGGIAARFNASAATISAVPEPGSWGLMAAGLGVVGAATARRRR